MTLTESLTGCLLGGALGDATGLAMEGLAPARLKKIFSAIDGPALPGGGFFSDDTEHLCLVMTSLACSGPDLDRFKTGFARALRRWFWALPAGIGLATLRACLKLTLGFGPDQSGVFSAGNGPAMRAAPIGVAWATEPARLVEFTRTHTRCTHTDPRAFWGALAVAWAAAVNSGRARKEANGTPSECFFTGLETLLKEEKGVSSFLDLIGGAVLSARKGDSLSGYLPSIGCHAGVSGYVLHTVPAVIQCWLRYDTQFVPAVREMITAGGDTDTTAAILGAILGAGSGPEGLPKEWIERCVDWPCSVSYLQSVASRLAANLEQNDFSSPPTVLPFPFLLGRNLLFMGLVLGVGFRRLLPPY